MLSSSLDFDDKTCVFSKFGERANIQMSPVGKINQILYDSLKEPFLYGKNLWLTETGQVSLPDETLWSSSSLTSGSLLPRMCFNTGNSVLASLGHPSPLTLDT